MKLSRPLALAFGLALGILAVAPPAAAQPATKKPNILVLFGDDIGYWNISAYNRGMMGYRTPNIDSIAKEGAIFTDVYAQQSCTAGRAAFITGQSPIRTGLLKVGLPGAPEGLSDEGPDDRQPAQGAGLRDRAVRQEPPRRPQRVHPDGPRLRRVLRQLLPPERRRGAREPGLPEGPGVPELQGEVRPARRVPLLRDGHREHASRRRPLREVGQAALRGHRPAHEEADGDDRRGSARPDHEVHRREAEGRQALVRLVQHDPHAHPHPPQGGVAGQDGARSRPGRHGRARRPHRPAAEEAGRHGCRRQHDRDLHDRQRRRGDELARRRRGAVPRREEHPLGGRLPRAARRALARRDQARHRDQRHHLARGLAADAAGGRGPARRQGVAAEGHDGRRERPTRSTSTATTCCRPSRARRRSGRATSSSTGPTTGSPRPCASTSGRWCSWSSAPRVSTSGRIRWSSCASPSSSTSARIRSSAPTRAYGYEHWRIEHAFLVGPAAVYVGQWMQSFVEFPPRQKPGSFNLSHVMEKLTKAEH